MIYKVVSITHLDGSPRTDGRYPLRVGREFTFIFEKPTVGHCMCLGWLRNNDGTPYSGFFRTSTVQKVVRANDGGFVVTTNNSIYTIMMKEGSDCHIMP